MFDTTITLVGNVLANPEWRRIPTSGALVANFKVASTARRYDKENSQWVDGNNLRIRVVAWRRLAEGVASSITVGDPVLVQGRLYTRDWKDESGNHRVSYEMEASAIGHDLSRGRARFFRTRAGMSATQLEDAEGETLVAGEQTVALAADEAPIAYGDGVPDVPEPTFAEPVPAPVPVPVPAPEPVAEPMSAAAPEPVAEPVSASASEPAPEDRPEGDEELALEVERLVAEEPVVTRRTRRARKEPVAA
ncbi:single-stranded DNA-binding protein [Actinoplanes sp. CA-142083]|uniref:single-stranded DNA-binding protein n=1 Tax=Actinoplanes sp. CA-142083 TaxID=3239903 RepID=UPI003D913BFD